MATTVEVTPTSGPEGTVFEFVVTDAPINSAPGRFVPADACVLSLEGPHGTGYGVTITRRNQTIRVDPTIGDDGENGIWQARLYRFSDFVSDVRDGLIIASAVFNVEAAA